MLLHAVIFQCAVAALNADAHAAFVFDGIGDFDDADLTGLPDMGGTTGANIVSRDRYDAHRAGQCYFAPVFQSIQLFTGKIGGANINIFPDCFVGKAFDLFELFRGQNAVKIKSDIFYAEMETDVIITETGVNQS